MQESTDKSLESYLEDLDSIPPILDQSVFKLSMTRRLETIWNEPDLSKRSDYGSAWFNIEHIIPSTL